MCTVVYICSALIICYLNIYRFLCHTMVLQPCIASTSCQSHFTFIFYIAVYIYFAVILLNSFYKMDIIFCITSPFRCIEMLILNC